MRTATKTLKRPFLCLHRAKAEAFARLQAMHTAVANALLPLSKDQRRALTSKVFVHVEIGSAWMNQTMRNANARTKVKAFRCLPLETKRHQIAAQKRRTHDD
jgi:hypothetical protein